MFVKRLITRNWFTQLWRLGSPTICCLQTEDTGKPVCKFQSEFKSLITRNTNGGGPGQNTNVPAHSGKERNSPFLHFFVLFRPTTDWMMPTDSEGTVHLLSLQIQMLSSSGNVLLTDTQNSSLLQCSNIWAPYNTSKSTHKITIAGTDSKKKKK